MTLPPMQHRGGERFIVRVNGQSVEFPLYTDKLRSILDKSDDLAIVAIERNSHVEPIPPWTLWNIIRWMFCPRMLYAMWMFPCHYVIVWRGAWKRRFGKVTFLDSNGVPFKYKQDAEREECRMILEAVKGR